MSNTFKILKATNKIIIFLSFQVEKITLINIKSENVEIKETMETQQLVESTDSSLGTGETQELVETVENQKNI